MRPLLVLCITLLLPLLAASSHLGASQDHVRDLLIANSGEQITRGAELYDRNCAVCHGDSGLGFDEGKVAFPEDHRKCTRCHKPHNPAVMSLEQVHAMGLDHDLFALGAPPALRGDGALASLPDAAALYHYTHAGDHASLPAGQHDRR